MGSRPPLMAWSAATPEHARHLDVLTLPALARELTKAANSWTGEIDQRGLRRRGQRQRVLEIVRDLDGLGARVEHVRVVVSRGDLEAAPSPAPPALEVGRRPNRSDEGHRRPGCRRRRRAWPGPRQALVPSASSRLETAVRVSTISSLGSSDRAEAPVPPASARGGPVSTTCSSPGSVAAR